MIKNSKIVFNPADGPDVEVLFAMATAPDNIATKHISSNGSTTMELAILKKDCSDCMSDETHPYNGLFQSTHHSGCGRSD